MSQKCNNFLYFFDFIGPTPQLLIFNEKRYKSNVSSIISIFILLFSIIFTIYSLLEYLKYNSPNIVYSKGNDEKTNRTIFINDIFLMFQFVDSNTLNSINNSIVQYNADYTIVYVNGTFDVKSLVIENCELGKNINLEYKSLFEDRNKFGRLIEEFYCINPKNENISLFYKPNIGYSSININLIYKNNSQYKPENMQTLIVSETDLIDHNNKSTPISKSYVYYLTSGYSSSEFTQINCRVNFLKYESDDGYFFKNSETFNGISFSDIASYRVIKNNYDLNNDLKRANYSHMGTITFNINESYYDNYKRGYQKLQSLLAEIMSVINLIFQIGNLSVYILIDKKMSKDIIISLINSKRKDDIINHNKQIKVKNEFIVENEISSRLKTEAIELKEKRNYSDYIDKNYKNDNPLKINRNSKKGNINSKATSIKVLKKLNFLVIFKSYFCFKHKNKKIKLLNLCHSIITEDICIERILERFYNLENIYHFNAKKDIFENKRFKDINKYIYDINYEILMEEIQKKNPELGLVEINKLYNLIKE